LRANKINRGKGIKQRSKIICPNACYDLVLGPCESFITRGKEYIANSKTWYLERLIRLLAGVLVFGSIFGHFVHPVWLIFTGFVGLMLTIFALTGFCPMSIILYALGARERCKV
jgi:hypothetical protein